MGKYNWVDKYEWAQGLTRAPVGTLEELASDDDDNVRRCLASNPFAPVGSLTKLADDKDFDIRLEVARNISTPVGVLTKLADEDRSVRIFVTQNPTFLATMSGDNARELFTNMIADWSGTVSELVNLCEQATYQQQYEDVEALAR